MEYRRQISHTIEKRLKEERQFIQVVIGPRQTGKTTAIQQALQKTKLPFHVANADSIKILQHEWVESQWIQARDLAQDNTAVLFIDEIQKIKNWSEIVKLLWDEDSWNKTELHVVISGSSSLLLNKGLTESLTGRYELLRCTHWDYLEMQQAFSYTLEDFVKFGGYPGGGTLKNNITRWKNYIKDSIINSAIEKDVLQLETIKKPALMKSLFELGSNYSAQELSYRKILGQLSDKGNAATIKHYLDLLDKAGIMCGLQKFDNKILKTKASSPRLLVYDQALMTANNKSLQTLLNDPSSKGHLIESIVGAALLRWSKLEDFDLYWWRDGNYEVDFIAQQDENIIAIEVKSGRIKTSGLLEFRKRYKNALPLVVGTRNLNLETFLEHKKPLFKT